MTLGVVRIETVWLGVGCSCSSTMTHVCAVEKLCNKYDNSGLSHFVRKGFCMLKLPKYLFAKRVHSVRVDDSGTKIYSEKIGSRLWRTRE